MKNIRKATAVIMAMLIVLSSIGVIMASAAKTITALEIVQLPKKLTFYQGDDWDYGYWSFPEGESAPSFVKKDGLISFMYNGGKHTYYEDRGMLDMKGLIVKVTYSDNTTENIEFKETVSGDSVYQNIIASPKGGYTLGENTIEVYFKANTKAYDSYKINIVTSKYQLGDVNMDKKINSSDALMVLQHVVGLITLTSAQLTYADVDSNSKINSADALAILRISVGA